MSMPRTPLQSVLKVLAAIDANLALNIEEDEVAEYLCRLVTQIENNCPAGEPDHPGLFFDEILTRIQQIDDQTHMLRHVCAQEASRLYQVYCLGGDYLLLERPYNLSHSLFN